MTPFDVACGKWDNSVDQNSDTDTHDDFQSDLWRKYSELMAISFNTVQNVSNGVLVDGLVPINWLLNSMMHILEVY